MSKVLNQGKPAVWATHDQSDWSTRHCRPMLHSAGGRFLVGWILVPQLPRCEQMWFHLVLDRDPALEAAPHVGPGPSEQRCCSLSSEWISACGEHLSTFPEL